ncbi:MAG: serine protease [Clostridia bacterium]|nr:serine protease [Clostridia bacterium]
MKNYLLIFLPLLMLAGVVTSCSRQIVLTPGAAVEDGRYDTEFPGPEFARALDEVSQSVIKIYCLVEYDHYQIDTTGSFITDDLAAGLLYQRTAKRTNFSESVHGSATVLKNDGGSLLLLTCAHIFDYPDTIISYYEPLAYVSKQGIESVSIKRQQTQFIREMPVGESLKIIAIDYDLDIAFLGAKSNNDAVKKLSPLGFASGNDRLLDRGSLVYVFGFPSGYQMVTRAMVANPSISKQGEFLLDANFNQGISGGAVLAVRDGVPNLELVGIAKSASAVFTNIVKPDSESHQQRYNPNLPYQGQLFVERQRNVNYGVTFAVSINTIRNFYRLNSSKFVDSGYSLENFFSSGNPRKKQ